MPDDTTVSISNLTNGNAVQGTAVTASFDDGGLGVTNATYQWQRDGADINGGNSATYLPTEQDEGHALTVKVGFTDASNNSHAGTGSAGTVQDSDDTVVSITGLL